MVFQLQLLSNHGSSTPAVARTLPQGCDLLEFFNCTEAQKDECKTMLFEVSRHLVRCVEVCDRVKIEVENSASKIAKDGLSTQSHGQVVNLPSIPDLTSQAETFLQSAKLAIRETARLTEPFFNEKRDHKYHKFASWAEAKFGTDDLMSRTARAWEPWVNDVVTMRNAVDHPNDGPRGRLIVKNFRLDSESATPTVLEPVWSLTGEEEGKILEQMQNIIEGIICIGEDVLIALFHKYRGQFPLAIYEIPEPERNPAMPKRFRIGLANEQ